MQSIATAVAVRGTAARAISFSNDARAPRRARSPCPWQPRACWPPAPRRPRPRPR
ncbi:hypothetical protein [Acidovorax sp. SDU_ACID1]|uniref:hypothetical protein n=1 Tax=Acidovorax sp. SDU_ACID1 TaxID=3136632 RepID=UPI0038732510